MQVAIILLVGDVGARDAYVALGAILWVCFLGATRIIEPVTFRFVAQYLNHCATAVPTSRWCSRCNGYMSLCYWRCLGCMVGCSLSLFTKLVYWEVNIVCVQHLVTQRCSNLCKWLPKLLRHTTLSLSNDDVQSIKMYLRHEDMYISKEFWRSTVSHLLCFLKYRTWSVMVIFCDNFNIINFV